MGRHAHIVRLALGRSPYTEPLRDENGDFILGPHAHEFDDSDYQQQFDDRGHPRNHASQTAARRLRRAQNDVLATVGVVVRKDEATKSNWERLDAGEKMNLIQLENQSGRELKATDRVAGVIFAWPFLSMRRRIQTFSLHFDVPATTLAWREMRSIGWLPVIASGLPFYLTSSIPQLYRYYIRQPDVEELVNYPNPDSDFEMSRGLQLAMIGIRSFLFCLEWPIQVFSTLQGLQIIGSAELLHTLSFVPFSEASPIWLPTPPTHITLAGASRYLIDCLQTPFCLGMIRDYLIIQIGYRTHALLRQVLIRTDTPDQRSAVIADKTDGIDETSIPGVGCPSINDPTTRNIGPRSFFGALRLAFPPLYWLLNIASNRRIERSRGRLDVEANNQLQIYTRVAYRRLKNQWQDISDRTDAEIRRAAIASAFDEINLDPDQELVDVQAWTNAALEDMDGLDSTATPDTDYLFDLTEIDLENTATTSERQTAAQPSTSYVSIPELQARTRTSDADQALAGSTEESQGSDNLLTTLIRSENQIIDTPDIPRPQLQFMPYVAPSDEGSADSRELDTIVIDFDRLQNDIQHSVEMAENNPGPIVDLADQPSDTSGVTAPLEMQDQRADVPDPAPQIVRPATPSPGISRAVSLQDGLIRPISRETDVGPGPNDSLAALSQTLRSRPSNRPTSRDYRLSLLPSQRTEHRVTFLSTFAVDSLAWHGSAIITNLILLPLEAMYLRSLVYWVTDARPGGILAGYISRSPMLRVMDTLTGDRLQVFGLNEWFGGSSASAVAGGRLKYAGSVLLALGLEALVRGTIWYIGTRTAIRRGKAFGWGKF